MQKASGSGIRGESRRRESVLSDLEIAQKAKLKPIMEISSEMGLPEEFIEPYGKYKAKVDLGILDQIKDRPSGKYIDVTAITPTPLGEGKTVTTVGLSLGLNHIGKNVITCIRQPSLGPVFGIKGGAAGGGYSQVVPMEDFNLHLTGDVHAVTVAHNLCAAFLDNAVYRNNRLNIDPTTIMLNRVVEVNDGALRDVVIGLGQKNNAIPRESGFDISVASEVMAILGLSKSLKDMRERIGRMVVAYTNDGKPVTTEDLGVAGSMTVLMKDALKPTLMQTLDHTPAFVHAGPFANIAHGNSSIVADMIALKLGDYVVTESGFGADMGMEKFFNIKCRISGLVPNAVVLVATIRALKMHSGDFKVAAGKPLDSKMLQENVDAVERGCCNLVKHIENVKLFGIPVVVAVNKFTTDADSEVNAVRELALEAGADSVATSDVWANGGKGGAELAEAVVEACEKPSEFKFLYPDDASIKEKIHAIATKVYGAKDVSYESAAKKKLKIFKKLGYTKLPICMAKTHRSLSHVPTWVGVPKDYTLPIRDIRASVGAGFLYPLCGEMSTMPTLPTRPAGEKIDIDEDGNVVGLF
jgi:formyltetrahydrofolate synthetase